MSEPYNTNPNPYTNPNPVDPDTNPADVPAQEPYGATSPDPYAPATPANPYAQAAPEPAAGGAPYGAYAPAGAAVPPVPPAQPAYGVASGGVPGGVPGNPYVSGAAYQPYYQPEPRWNAMAIAGFVASFMVSIVGLVLSIIGLNQINRTGEKGRGLAIAGIIVGALSTLVSVVFVVLFVTAVVDASSHGYDYSYDDGGDGYDYSDEGDDTTNAADRLAAAPDSATARLDVIVAATAATLSTR